MPLQNVYVRVYFKSQLNEANTGFVCLFVLLDCAQSTVCCAQKKNLMYIAAFANCCIYIVAFTAHTLLRLCEYSAMQNMRRTARKLSSTENIQKVQFSSCAAERCIIFIRNAVKICIYSAWRLHQFCTARSRTMENIYKTCVFPFPRAAKRCRKILTHPTAWVLYAVRFSHSEKQSRGRLPRIFRTTYAQQRSFAISCAYQQSHKSRTKSQSQQYFLRFQLRGPTVSEACTGTHAHELPRCVAGTTQKGFYGKNSGTFVARCQRLF